MHWLANEQTFAYFLGGNTNSINFIIKCESFLIYKNVYFLVTIS